jgi:hypothetical protein
MGDQVRARHPGNPGNDGGKCLKIMRPLGATWQRLGLGRRSPHETDAVTVTYQPSGIVVKYQ